MAVLNKSSYLTLVATLTGTLRQGTDVVDPSIVIEQATLPSFNYVFITEFNRYYFVRDIVNISNNLWELRLHCDVLFSYATDIGELVVDVERNEFDYDFMLEDTERGVESKYDLEIIEAGNAEMYFDLPTTTPSTLGNELRYIRTALS